MSVVVGFCLLLFFFMREFVPIIFKKGDPRTCRSRHHATKSPFRGRHHRMITSKGCRIFWNGETKSLPYPRPRDNITLLDWRRVKHTASFCGLIQMRVLVQPTIKVSERTSSVRIVAPNSMLILSGSSLVVVTFRKREIFRKTVESD